jgi:hypothetical protein
MCLERAAGWKIDSLNGDEAEADGQERPARGEAEEPMRSITLGCSGCAEMGYCRRGLDQEQLSSNFIGCGPQTGI